MTLESDLRHATGTENWYQHWTKRFTFTDGVKTFADDQRDSGGQYWFIDKCAAYIVNHAKEPMISIKMVVADEKATITVQNGKCKVIETEQIEWTDCPAGTYKFLFMDNVLMLTSEY